MTWSCLLTSFLLWVGGKKGTTQQTEVGETDGQMKDAAITCALEPLPGAQPQAHAGMWQLCDLVPMNF